MKEAASRRLAKVKPTSGVRDPLRACARGLGANASPLINRDPESPGFQCNCCCQMLGIFGNYGNISNGTISGTYVSYITRNV